MDTNCSIDDCTTPVWCRGYCNAHYKRALDSGTIQRVRTAEDAKCVHEDCEEKNTGRSKACKKHRKVIWARELPVCSIEECGKKGITKGFCREHWSSRQEERPVSESRRWIDKHGYVIVYCPGHPYANGPTGREHTLLMAEKLGRKLLPHESVHHKNGNRSDNRMENLELWSKSQPPGQRVEDKLAWAREIIELYG